MNDLAAQIAYLVQDVFGVTNQERDRFAAVVRSMLFDALPHPKDSSSYAYSFPIRKSNRSVPSHDLLRLMAKRNYSKDSQYRQNIPLHDIQLLAKDEEPND